MTKDKALAKIWRETHSDFKGTLNGEKTIMVFRPALGSCLVALSDLSDAEIRDRVKEYAPA